MKDQAAGAPAPSDEQARAQGERAVRTDWWAWFPGMLVVCGDGRHVERLVDGGDYDFCDGAHVRGLWWPDFRDPATRGALIEQVRTAHGNELAHAYTNGGRWFVALPESLADCHEMHPDADLYGHATEVEALVAALEAAP